MLDSMLLKAALSFLPHKFINIQSQKRFVYSLYSFDFRFASIPATLEYISKDMCMEGHMIKQRFIGLHYSTGPT